MNIRGCATATTCLMVECATPATTQPLTTQKMTMSDVTPELVARYPRIYANHIMFLRTEIEELRGTLGATHRELKRLIELYEQLPTES